MTIRKTLRIGLLAGALVGGMSFAAVCRADDAAPTTAPAAGPLGGRAGEGGRPGQAGRQGPMQLLNRVQQAVNGLGLSPDQQKQMDKVFTDARQNLRDLLPQLRTMQQDERREKLKSFATDLRQRVMDILTDDQKAQLKEKFPGIMQNQGGGEKLAQFKQALDSLDLTDDQKKQIDDLLQTTRQQMKEIMSSGDGTDNQQQLQALRQDVQEKLRNILTQDQLDELRDKMQDLQTQPGNVPATQPAGN